MSYSFDNDFDEINTYPDKYFPISIRKLADLLNVGRNRLFTFLRNEGVLHPNNEPGYASEKDWFVENEMYIKEELKHNTKATKKGALEIQKMVEKFGRKNIQALKVYNPGGNYF